jgi:hypothetical protein
VQFMLCQERSGLSKSGVVAVSRDGVGCARMDGLLCQEKEQLCKSGVVAVSRGVASCA